MNLEMDPLFSEVLNDKLIGPWLLMGQLPSDINVFDPIPVETYTYWLSTNRKKIIDLYQPTLPIKNCSHPPIARLELVQGQGLADGLIEGQTVLNHHGVLDGALFSTLSGMPLSPLFLDHGINFTTQEHRAITKLCSHYLLFVSCSSLVDNKFVVFVLKKALHRSEHSHKVTMCFQGLGEDGRPSMNNMIMTVVAEELSDCAYCLMRGESCICSTSFINRIVSRPPNITTSDMLMHLRWLIGLYQIGIKKERFHVFREPSGSPQTHEYFYALSLSCNTVLKVNRSSGDALCMPQDLNLDQHKVDELMEGGIPKSSPIFDTNEPQSIPTETANFLYSSRKQIYGSSIHNEQEKQAALAALNRIEELHSENASTLCCSLCGIQVKRKFDLRRHLKAVHMSDRRYTCEKCNKSFTRREHLLAHLRGHAKGPYPCSLCNKDFISEHNLDRHMQNVHKICVEVW